MGAAKSQNNPKPSRPPHRLAKNRTPHKLRMKLTLFSWILLGAVVATGILFGIWIQENTQQKLFHELLHFQIPEQPTEFDPKAYASVLEWIKMGHSGASWLMDHYKEGNLSQKTAILLILGETKGPLTPEFLIDVIENDDARLIPFAVYSFGKLQSLGISIVIEKIRIAKERKPYLITALANTRHTEAIAALLSYTKDPDPRIRLSAIEGISLFPKEAKILEGLPLFLTDPEPSVATAGLKLLQFLAQQRVLGNVVEKLSLRIQNDFQNTTNPETRGILIRAMGVVGPYLKPDGSNYIPKFQPLVREAFQKGTLAEKTAAAWTIGCFLDTDLKQGLLDVLAQENPELTQNAAESLVALCDPEIPAYILQHSWPQTGHSQIAIAQILAQYHTYILRMNLESQSIAFLIQAWQKADASAIAQIAESLGRFTKEHTAALLWQPEHIKDFHALAQVLKNQAEPLSQCTKFFIPAVQEWIANDTAHTNVSREIQAQIILALNRLLAQDDLPKLLSNPNTVSKIQDIQKAWQENHTNSPIHLHRILLEELYPNLFFPNPLLCPIHFSNVEQFVERIKPRSKKDPKIIQNSFTRWTWDLLPGVIHQKLTALESGKTIPNFLQWEFIQELNLAFQRNDWYNTERMQDMKIPKELVQLQQKKLSPLERIYANRKLFQHVFGKEIKVLQFYDGKK